MSSEDPARSAIEGNPAGYHEILRLFAGRRQGTRVDREHAIECLGVGGAFRGRTINLSRLGTLLSIEDEGFPLCAGAGALLAVAGEVRRQFPKGITIRFQDARVRVTADVVRVVPHPTGSGVVIGCGFARPLTQRQCRALDVLADDRGDASSA